MENWFNEETIYFFFFMLLAVVSYTLSKSVREHYVLASYGLLAGMIFIAFGFIVDPAQVSSVAAWTVSILVMAIALHDVIRRPAPDYALVINIALGLSFLAALDAPGYFYGSALISQLALFPGGGRVAKEAAE